MLMRFNMLLHLREISVCMSFPLIYLSLNLWAPTVQTLKRHLWGDLSIMENGLLGMWLLRLIIAWQRIYQNVICSMDFPFLCDLVSISFLNKWYLPCLNRSLNFVVSNALFIACLSFKDLITAPMNLKWQPRLDAARVIVRTEVS